MGVEPTSSAWKAEVLPLNYTRSFSRWILAAGRWAPAQQALSAAMPFESQLLRSSSQPPAPSSLSWWRGEDSNLRRLSRQIYSLIPLTTREPLPRTKPVILGKPRPAVNR